MTNDELRIVLAKWAGWTEVEVYEDNQGPPILCGFEPYSVTVGADGEWKADRPKYHRHVPNYVFSLDCVATLEARLTHEQRIRYFGELAMVTLNSGFYRPEITATAEQRCRALVAALNISL